MCMINEMKRRIEELETERNNALAEVEQLKAQNEHMRGILEDARAALRHYAQGQAESDIEEIEIALSETPAQSLAEIQARAVDEFAGTYLAHVKGLDSVSVQGLRQSLVVYSNQILYREKDRLIANPTENN